MCLLVASSAVLKPKHTKIKHIEITKIVSRWSLWIGNLSADKWDLDGGDVQTGLADQVV
jgi:hypothetical protein